jgi:hypothetical protein
MPVTMVPTVPNPGAVRVAVGAGQFLHFIVDAVGPIPIFSFASNIKGLLFEAPDFPGHPVARYEWVHLQNPSDVQQLELLNLVVSFLTNSSYVYTVQLRNAAGIIATVLQISYTGSPTDIASESFRVLIV